MASEDSWRKIGGWAFILGALIAIVSGAAAPWVGQWAGLITLGLLILGLIVGFLNIGSKEIFNFLIAGIALASVGLLTQLVAIDQIIPFLGTLLHSIVARITEFVLPGVLVVSLKAIWKISKGA